MMKFGGRWIGLGVALGVSLAALSCRGDADGGHPDPEVALAELRAVEPEVVVATVNGQTLGLDEFMAYWKEHRELDAEEALNGLVARELLVQQALDSDEQRGTAEMSFARKQAMVRVLLDELVEKKVTVEDLIEADIAQVTAEVVAHVGQPTGARASHILVRVPEDAKGEREPLYGQARQWIDTIAASLTSEDAEADLAVEALYVAEAEFGQKVPEPLEVIVNAHLTFPIENVGDQQRALPEGWIHVVPEFSAGAAALAGNNKSPALSEPVRSGFGWHLILLEHVIEARKPEPEGLRAFAVQETLRRKRAELVEELLVSWVEDSTIYL
ncbi:MAG: hypothetical protein ACNA8W_22775, partial [Bradymonadaceae bacterium]